MKPELDPESKNVQGRLFDQTGPALVYFIDMKNLLVRLRRLLLQDVYGSLWVGD